MHEGDVKAAFAGIVWDALETTSKSTRIVLWELFGPSFAKVLVLAGASANG
jgi:hypothetical protein